MSHSILDLEAEELAAWLTQKQIPAYRADQILHWIYGRRIFSYGEMSNLPADLRGQLAEALPLALPKLIREVGAVDSTRKFLFALADAQRIETVLIPASPALYGSASDRLTLCISSQVGCAYGCKFCASGLAGWKRNLRPGEIVGQLLAVEALAGARVNNIVFMGMGEPFANFDNLMKAIRILNARWGVGLGARHMTVSTSGLVPRIREFSDQPLQIRLAISLHGATDDVRERIMPINRKYPLAQLLDACRYFASKKKQRLTFEYILIRGVNDSLDQASRLAKIAKPLSAKINVIPYNTVSGLEWERPTPEVQDQFLAALRSRGVAATLRREKGHDIAAACGQLRLVEAAESLAGQGG